MDGVGTASGSNSSVPFCAPSLSFHPMSYFPGGTMGLSLTFERGERSPKACLELFTTLSNWYCAVQPYHMNLWSLGPAA